MTRVLHVAPYYPPARIGGVGSWVSHLHGGLSAAGHESEVITWGHGPAPPGVRHIARSPAGWLAALAGEAARARRFEVVHVHGGEALPLVAALRAGRARPRLIGTWHGVSARAADALTRAARLRARAHALLERAVLPHLDALVAVSAACAAELARLGIARSARVIRAGLPELPDGGDLPPRAELLYAGRPGARKRVALLPTVLARVREKHPAARLRIAGFAPGDAPGLARAFAARRLDAAVEWCGPLPPRALAACYRAADALLLPSAYEGLPLVALEAMQAGLPVVATRLPGLCEALDDGEQGWLVPVDAPGALAERCCALLDDPALRARMGRAGAARVRERFPLARMVREHAALYAELAGERAR